MCNRLRRQSERSVCVTCVVLQIKITRVSLTTELGVESICPLFHLFFYIFIFWESISEKSVLKISV